ncbi:Predicted hydrolase of the alpha/beta superfamily [Mesobacillus persicus]|uniref:Predicted hydrolase of the alpha/beta superfamily n=1 Tax=Mesobacillus persicus TaxID=930146 RepID=A0A1H8I1Y9_9BACI|nr:alpha/beta hydrolase-fold protein [Mesobacillus persicus]SEN62344.1 Predicted hydrolase of the alpha/beta superfamily [Mesobacillus persicus]
MIETCYVPLFNSDRKIRIYLPKNYEDSTKKFPVLYMHDGQNVFDCKESIGGVSLELHEYLDQEQIELIVVAIDLNPEGEERLNEYCPWKNGKFSERLLGYPSSSGGKGEQYVEFIVNELKPIIDNRYKTISTANYIAGISLGGLISLYAACRYPEIFTRVAAFSSAYFRNQEELESLLKTADLSLLEKVYLDCGTNESTKSEEISQLFLASNQAVFEIVKDKVVNTEFHQLEGAEHNYDTFKKRVPEAIASLISG